MKKILKAEKFVNSLIKRQSVVGNDPNSFEPDLIKKEIQNEESLAKWKTRGKEATLNKSVGNDEDASPLMNRIEDKFFLKASKLNNVITKLKENLKLGDIDTDTRYSVNRTIYLDNRDLDSFQDNMMGVKPRFKVRIRQYNPNGEGWEDVAYVELKIKDEKGLSRKIRVRIPASVIEPISNGQAIDSNEKLVNLNRDIPKSTLWKRIASINSIILKSGFKKQLVVEYNRRAYSGDDIRITIDDSLKYHSFRPIEKDILGYITHSDHWKKSTKSTRELMSNDLLIMEVKHSGEIPKWVENILKESKAEEARFSKYCAAIASFIMSGEKTEGRVQQQKKIGAYEVLNILDGKEEIAKSENDLNKAPLIYEQGEDFAPNKLNHHAFDTNKHQEIRTTPLKNGLFHHIYRSKNNKNYIIHSLSLGNIEKPISLIAGSVLNKTYIAGTTATRPNEQGNGHGTELKKLALKYHGKMESDAIVSPAENASWEKLKNTPKVKVNLGPSQYDVAAETGLPIDHPDVDFDVSNQPHVATYKKSKLKKSENDLAKGMNGDWKKEGYTISHSYSIQPHPSTGEKENILTIVASHPKYGDVGSAKFYVGDPKNKKDNNLYTKDLVVHPNHRRKGLATAMYQHGEGLHERIIHDDQQSPDAKALWSQPNRMFGNDTPIQNAVKMKKSGSFQINISIPEDEDSLDKSEFYTPSQEGEEHPTKPYVAVRHPEGQLMWHHNKEMSTKNDSIINDPQMRQRLLSKMPTPTHKAGMSAIMDMVAKDPQRHFIPSRDAGKEKMRARHIKSLILSPEQSKIDLDANNVLSISMPRHGTMGGSTTWNYNLKPKKVVKSEQNELGNTKQGRNFEINERVFSGRDLRKHERSGRSVEKTQHSGKLSGTFGRLGSLSGKHLKRLDIMKGAMNRLAPFRPEKTVTPEAHKATENWTAEGDDQSARSNVPEMHANAKTRALHKLGGLTQVRKHPKTGERMFLLHRGMGENEYRQNHIGSVSEYAPGTMTSWTPKYSVASDFANDHLEGKKPRIASAWIPESEIHNVPNAMTVPDEDSQFRHEHEVMVNHMTPHPHANQDLVLRAKNPRLFLDNKINMKGQAEKVKNEPFAEDQKMNDQVKRSKRAEQFKRERFGKSEIENVNILTKADISGKIKQGIAGIAMTAATLAPANLSNSQPEADRQPQMVQPKKMVNPNKQRILDSIADVESSGGKNTDHAPLPTAGIHQGEHAHGKFGLMPLTIRETVKANPNLFKKHSGLSKLTGDSLHEYMDKNPNLENQIAQVHYDRLAKHFGHAVDKIAMAWNNGITGTNRAIKQGMDIKKHPYVQKVMDHYNQRIKSVK